MARVLIAFGTTEGHTRKIAETIAGWLREAGHEPTLFDTSQRAANLEISNLDGAILAGSLHQVKHQPSLAAFARDHASALNAIPTLFLSVSLTAIVQDDRHRAEAQAPIDAFIEETGFKPSKSLPVAGALKYTQYDFMKRFSMRLIVKKEGGDIDTSQDYEYTDWEALRREVEAWLSQAFPTR